AHRFAVARHRKRRSKRTLASRLDEVPGIGPRRRRRLLQRFGSLQGVREAPLEALQEELGQAVGRKVWERLSAGGGAAP
ncbi:MAG TPA: excinuclease ABC subunit C, partial [Thermoanaerobaculia bacterium]